MNQSLISQRFKYPSQSTWKLSRIQTGAKADFERKIVEGIYTFEEAKCFCGSSDGIVIAECERHGLRLNTVICPSCGILRTSPRMTQASYQQFYDSEYRTLEEDADIDLEALFFRGLKEGEAVFDFIRQHLDLSSGVVFDVGCNMGTSLYLFQQHGFKVAGVDYGSRHIEYGRERTRIQDLYVGGIEELEKLEQKADLVILRHVVEHFAELENELNHIRNLIKPGGYIFIEVPGIYSWIRNNLGWDFMGYLVSAHTFGFCLTTLTYVMECVGFELYWGSEYIKSIYTKSEKYRRKSHHPKGELKRTMNYLKFTEFLYRLGCSYPRLQEFLYRLGFSYPRLKWFVLPFTTGDMNEVLIVVKKLIKGILVRLKRWRL